jgi:hypothetical protein
MNTVLSVNTKRSLLNRQDVSVNQRDDSKAIGYIDPITVVGLPNCRTWQQALYRCGGPLGWFWTSEQGCDMRCGSKKATSGGGGEEEVYATKSTTFPVLSLFLSFLFQWECS